MTTTTPQAIAWVIKYYPPYLNWVSRPPTVVVKK